MRAPGGSFICPKTSIVFSRTPDSFISSHRSLPSRERSPTPQKADRPSCSSARLRISSWMITVLPTPAPPNNPTLPPLAYGASRSTTLIPVSNISVVGVSSSTVGAARWIGQRSTSSGRSGPRSMGSPNRLKIRPSVTRPTGTVIGAPVSITSVPLERPSVVSMATARTRSSPRCCCTSHTRILVASGGEVDVLLGAGDLGALDAGSRGRSRGASRGTPPRSPPPGSPRSARCSAARDRRPGLPCLPLLLVPCCLQSRDDYARERVALPRPGPRLRPPLPGSPA